MYLFVFICCISSVVFLFLVEQVYQQVLNDQGQSLINNLVNSVEANKLLLENVLSEKELDKVWLTINGVST